MKTKVLIALCFVAAQTFAQKMNSKDVPANVKASLEKNHLAKEAKWEKEGENYEANFKKGGKEMSAVFDGTGTLIETEVEIARHELPARRKTFLRKNMPVSRLKKRLRSPPKAWCPTKPRWKKENKPLS